MVFGSELVTSFYPCCLILTLLAVIITGLLRPLHYYLLHAGRHHSAHLWITNCLNCFQFDSGDSSMSGPSSFVLFSFFHFIRRFWNHILICLSVKQSACAISILRLRVRYRLKWNSFSSSRVWYRVYVCRPRFLSNWLLIQG